MIVDGGGPDSARSHVVIGLAVLVGQIIDHHRLPSGAITGEQSRQIVRDQTSQPVVPGAGSDTIARVYGCASRTGRHAQKRPPLLLPCTAQAPLSNLPAFAEAFSCKAGDPMLRSGDANVKIW